MWKILDPVDKYKKYTFSGVCPPGGFSEDSLKFVFIICFPECVAKGPRSGGWTVFASGALCRRFSSSWGVLTS